MIILYLQGRLWSGRQTPKPDSICTSLREICGQKVKYRVGIKVWNEVEKLLPDWCFRMQRTQALIACLKKQSSQTYLIRVQYNLNIWLCARNHCCIKDDAVCLGSVRSNLQHTYLLSEVLGRIWMPLIVNVKLKSTDSDQVSNCMVGLKSLPRSLDI